MSVAYPAWSMYSTPMPQQAPGYYGYYGYPAYAPTYTQPAWPTSSPVTPQPTPTPKPATSHTASNDELAKILEAMSQQQPAQPQKKAHVHGKNEDHDKEHNGESKPLRVMKHLAIAGGMFLFGMLLSNPLLPVRNAHTFKLISADWKDWAKIITGIITVTNLNKALDWKPSPFFSAAESVAVINVLTSGFNKGSALNLMIMAPIVGTVVQLGSSINEKIEKPLQEKAGIPPLLTKLAISAGTIALGLKAYPTLLRGLAQTGILGKESQKEIMKTAGNVYIGAEGMICARGCCNFILCLSEIGEMISAYLNKGKKSSQSERSSH